MPGSIVLRKTTVCRPSCSASAAPISSATRSRYVGGQAAVGRRRRADADQRDLAGRDRLARRRVVARNAPVRTTSAVSSPIRSSTTGALPLDDQLDLDRVHVDADDLVPLRGQAGGRHAADVAEPEDADLS